MKPGREKPAYELTWVTDNLAVGGAPMSYEQLESIKAQGIGAILNLCGEFCDLHDIERGGGFEVHYLPVYDEEAPGLEALERALAWLDEAVYLGKKVLIHCRHGIGRTGTVLNAYLLRRGLGHKVAAQVLRRLKSKPANFEQWWTVRRYGRQSGRLTIREPSLEYRQLVDLAPYFTEYEALAARVDARFEAMPGLARCGLGHDRCCRTPVHLSLMEAVYLSHGLNTALTSEARASAIERAVETARRERETALSLDGEGRVRPGEGFCLSNADSLCPLSEEGRCLAYRHRPLQCRSHDMPAAERAELFDTLLAPGLTRLSRELFLAFSSAFAPELPAFSLADVVSGRYVQSFFHALMAAEGGAAASKK